MNLYMMPISDVQEGDTLVITSESVMGNEPREVKLPVLRTRRVGSEVWVYTTKFKYRGGQPIPLYYGADAMVGVER